MTNAPAWSYSMTLEPEPENVAAARRFVRERLELHEVSSLVEDVTLAASELATNSLVHARTPFTVAIMAFPDAVVLRVEDGSTTFPVRMDARPVDSAGRGIAIVEVVSREWGVVGTQHGKYVWAAFEVG